MVDGQFDKPDSEQSLLEQAIQGEASAFGLLYDKYQPRLYRFIYLKVSHREEAEDLTHQVFLSAWQNIKHFQDQGLPISSWLYHIARNKVIDYYRTKKFTTDIDSLPEDLFGNEQDPTAQAHAKFLLEKIALVLHELSPDQQDIILMRFVEELTNKEIARITGKNIGTVRVLQHRALRHLKKYTQDL